MRIKRERLSRIVMLAIERADASSEAIFDTNEMAEVVRLKRALDRNERIVIVDAPVVLKMRELPGRAKETLKHFGLACESETCPLKRTCAQHTTTGDFRSEDGPSPDLIVEDVPGQPIRVLCHQQVRSDVMGELMLEGKRIVGGLAGDGEKFYLHADEKRYFELAKHYPNDSQNAELRREFEREVDALARKPLTEKSDEKAKDPDAVA